MKLYQIIEKLGRPEKPVVSFVGAGGKTSCILELADDWAARGKSVLITTTVHMEEPKILGEPVGSTSRQKTSERPWRLRVW